MNRYVFGYGSLISAESLSRGIRRTVTVDELIPCWLEGFARTWTVKEQVFSHALGQQITAVFLNVEAQPGEKCNGVLARVSEEELGRLKLREKNYECVEITRQMVFEPGSSPEGAFEVFTFACTGEQRVNGADGKLYVLNRYVEMVESACRRLGERFYQDYLRSTQPAPFERVEGSYSFVDAAQKKYV